MYHGFLEKESQKSRFLQAGLPEYPVKSKIVHLERFIYLIYCNTLSSLNLWQMNYFIIDYEIITSALHSGLD